MAEKNHGPMRGNARGPRPNVANPGKLLLRLLSYIFKNYGFALSCPPSLSKIGSAHADTTKAAIDPNA